MEGTFSWWSCPVQATLPCSPASLTITTAPWLLLPRKAGPTRTHEWGTPHPWGMGSTDLETTRIPAAIKQRLGFLPLGLCKKKVGGRELTWLMHVKEIAITGGLWAASQPLCTLVHLVQCVTVLHLTAAVNGSHLACGLCSPSPSVLRAAEERQKFFLWLFC